MKSLETYFYDLLGYFERQSKFFSILVGVLCIFVLGVIDYLTGYEIQLGILYLIPISLTTWYAGRKGGILVSIIGTTAIFMADMMGGIEYSHPIIWLWNTIAILTIFLVVVKTLSSLKRALEREQTQARTDILTGAFNSGYFKLLTDMEIERCRRYKNPFTLAYIDCDNFKMVNDRFGHSVGDKLLILIVDTIRKNIRKTDIVGRFGGDEFGILLSESGEEHGKEVIEKLRRILVECVTAEGWPVTFSVGAATYLSAPNNADEVIRVTDSLMYSAKNSGKNNLQYHIHR